MKNIKFKALFKNINHDTKIWFFSTVNDSIYDIGYKQLSEWLQYVGILDIKNKEIYEYDIFRFIYLEELHKPIELLGYFEFGEDLSFEINVFGNDAYTVLRYINNGQFYDFEVIGNIKETPDFFEKLED